MAITGSSFAIFVGPWFCDKIGVSSLEGLAAVSWVMGASGVYLVRAVLNWLDKRGVDAIDKFVNKAIGDTSVSSNPPKDVKKDPSKRNSDDYV